MNKKQFLELLAKILPESTEFELRPQKRGSGYYAIAEVVSQERVEFSLGGDLATGKPKMTFIFGTAVPKGAVIPVAKKSGVSLESWKSQYAK